MTRILSASIGFLATLGLITIAAEDPPGSPRQAEPRRPIVSGRILDGLGSPVRDAHVTIRAKADSVEELADVRSGEDGAFSCSLAGGNAKVIVEIAKKGFVYGFESAAVPSAVDDTLRRRRDLSDLEWLQTKEGAELDRGVRELLGSEDGDENAPRGFVGGDREEADLFRSVFRDQAALHPALRRLVGDPNVGEEARDLLDRLGDPADRNLFNAPRKFAPKHDVAEEDLVVAIKATSRHRNFFSSRPEPEITVTKIPFDPRLDHALVDCGINPGPFTGVFWRFVFAKDGNRWILRSLEETGRG